MINNYKERRIIPESSTQENFNGNRNYFDEKENIKVVKIISGEWYVSNNSEMLSTILGSCVSACIRDKVRKIGGMNHFMLPGDDATVNNNSSSARYGVFAMEMLINGILKLGGQRERFEIKVFGGGNVTNSSARIGSKNAVFIREYLAREGFDIVSEDLEGDFPRRVHYYPETGKVMVHKLKRKEDMIIIEEENRYKNKITNNNLDGNIELF